MRLARGTASHRRLVTMYGRRRDDDESGAGIDHCRYPATTSPRKRHPGAGGGSEFLSFPRYWTTSAG
jgi:hypothetical protein